MFNALIRRKKPKCQQHLLTGHAKLVLIMIRGDERYIGNSMRDEVDLSQWRMINLLQHRLSPLSHNNQPRRVRDQFLHHTILVGVRLEKNRMKGRDHRRMQLTEQSQQVTTSRATENSELMLDRDNVHIAVVQEAGGAHVGRRILLLNLEANDVRILIGALDIVDRHRKASFSRMLRCHGPEQVGGERGNAALARQVVAKKRDCSNTGFCFHNWPTFGSISLSEIAGAHPHSCRVNEQLTRKIPLSPPRRDRQPPGIGCNAATKVQP